ncbi:cytochrome P450 [Polyplosphaeria fusca]|uniref:Cytochrome P450 n=1 Tax=Polyplosphaeria fusca TaxID=682080 RepID=A0A9P4UWY2_9PLEO|nr:cytochrome P450 [Polyplosphaeria fusca]
MEVFQSPAVIALVIFTSSVLLALFERRRQRRRQALQNGCDLPPRYKAKEPFWAFDFTMKLFGDVHTMAENMQKYGKTFIVESLFSAPIIFTADAQNMPAMASKDWGNGWRRQGFEQFTGRGILTEDGEMWHQARKMIRPGFAKSNISEMSYYESVVEDFIKHLPVGRTVDIQPLFIKTASLNFMNNALHWTIGFDAMNPPKDAPYSRDEFLKLWDQGVMGTGLRLMLGSMKFLLPDKSFNRVCDSIRSFVDYHIERAMKRNDTQEPKRFVDAFISESDDRSFIRNHLIQGIIGAQDTTSVLMSNTIHFLARRPELWKELREEVLSKGDDIFSFDSLRTNTFMQNIFSESLRLRPVFPAFQRRSLRATTLPTGGGPDGTAPIYCPADTDLHLSFYALHRDPRVFGPDVEEFNPQRWKTIKPTQFEYIPFGVGPRNCLGREKSLVEAAWMLARLAREFERVEGRGSGKWQGVMKISCANKFGCEVAFFSSTRGQDGTNP